MRILLAAVLLLLLAPAFAGCLGDSTGSTENNPGTIASRDDLRFRPFVDLGSAQRPGAFGTNCQDSLADGDCGLGEPQVEVDAAGTIYVSGVCCLTVPPPVYVSRDGGETFTDLATTTQVREQFGIEGDFAVDGEGRIYFADIEFAASFQVSVWDRDGAFLHHTKWPAVPIVDRDWIRAEGDGHLYYVYNTGTSTNVYTSTDTGRTWSPAPIHTAPFGLGMAVKGNAMGELWVIGGGGNTIGADVTRDGGLTWSSEDTTIPNGGNFPVAAFDEAGSMFGAGGSDDELFVARRDADGTWNPAVKVSPAGNHRMPWFATGPAAGTAALCWYGTPDETIGPASEWFVYVGHSLGNGENGTWHVEIADTEPVFVGELGRDLLDFFQCEVGPDGAMHIAYSKLRPSEGGPEEQLQYVRSEPHAALAATRFPWGPTTA
ncbi:MAG: beta propeller repeat protein [Thermoplasmatota archaeon]